MSQHGKQRALSVDMRFQFGQGSTGFRQDFMLLRRREFTPLCPAKMKHLV
jgi:hypothetical protein